MHVNKTRSPCVFFFSTRSVHAGEMHRHGVLCGTQKSSIWIFITTRRRNFQENVRLRIGSDHQSVIGNPQLLHPFSSILKIFESIINLTWTHVEIDFWLVTSLKRKIQVFYGPFYSGFLAVLDIQRTRISATSSSSSGWFIENFFAFPSLQHKRKLWTAISEWLHSSSLTPGLISLQMPFPPRRSYSDFFPRMSLIIRSFNCRSLRQIIYRPGTGLPSRYNSSAENPFGEITFNLNWTNNKLYWD